MKKEKKLRITINKMFNSSRYVTIWIICLIFGIGIGRLAISIISPISTTDIMRYKDLSYEIYNEGLLTNHYESIKVETPKKSDVEMLVNRGLKYVTYKDLMNIEIEYGLYKIEFTKNTFKFYEIGNIKYTQIIVDSENVHDISYYEYETGINYMEILKYIIVFLVLCLLFLIIATSIDVDLMSIDSDEDKEDDADDEIETEEVATEDSFEETKETEKEE